MSLLRSGLIVAGAGAALVGSHYVGTTIRPYWEFNHQLQQVHGSAFRDIRDLVRDLESFQRQEQQVLFAPGDPTYKGIIGGREVSSWQYTHDVKYGFQPGRAAVAELSATVMPLFYSMAWLIPKNDSFLARLTASVSMYLEFGTAQFYVLQSHRRHIDAQVKQFSELQHAPQMLYWKAAHDEFLRTLSPFAAILPADPNWWERRIGFETEVAKTNKIRQMMAQAHQIESFIGRTENALRELRAKLPELEKRFFETADQRKFLFNGQWLATQPEGQAVVSTVTAEIDLFRRFNIPLRPLPRDHFELHTLVKGVYNDHTSKVINTMYNYTWQGKGVCLLNNTDSLVHKYTWKHRVFVAEKECE